MLTITISTLLLISLSSTSAAEHNITNSTVGGLNKTVAESSDGDWINLENGIYTDNITNIIIDKNLTIKGENRENTILNAQQLGRIFYINPGNTLTLINITIINGYANSGGAIFNNGGKITLTNCNFSDNTANDGSGGAIFNSGPNMEVTNSSFSNNTASRAAGAIFNNAINITVINSIFNNNVAGIDGGAIEHSGSNLKIINSRFINNRANSSGGAVYNYASDLEVTNSNFTNNTSLAPDSWGGGAIYSTGGNKIIINSSKFTNNKATSYGGAIDIYYGDNITVTNSEFNGNNASYGGAIFNTAGTKFLINSSKFNKNKASNDGGAIYNYYTEEMNVVDSNFTENTAEGYGGVIFNDAMMKLSGNIMENNNALLGKEIYNNGSMGILKLKYLNNSTIKVNNKTKINIYATLTDDMGNSITGQNISFYVNGEYIGVSDAIEGYATIEYTVIGNKNDNLQVTGNYSGHDPYAINIANGMILIVANQTNHTNHTNHTNNTNHSNINNENSTTNQNSNNIASAKMKETGIPTTILLVLVILVGSILIKRKK